MKNAAESAAHQKRHHDGRPRDSHRRRRGDGHADRGKGAAPDVLRSALLPFFSTKKTGSGLGLALCHEIIEAHGGRLSLHPRESGGLSVKCWLPGAPPKS
jgi:signal transduction histidine kinase